MSWDSVWEEVFKGQEWGRYPSESLIRFIAGNFYCKDRKNIKILEVGCGPGANIWYMAREGFDAYGIDASSTAIEKAKRRMEKEGLKAQLRVRDIETLPYPADYFDAVVDCECLAHNSAKDTRRILEEIKRTLKKGGLFYSRAFTDKTYAGRSKEKTGNLEFINASDSHFAGRGFFRLISESGIEELYGAFFKLISVDTLEYSAGGGPRKVSEWVIICQKDRV